MLFKYSFSFLMLQNSSILHVIFEALFFPIIFIAMFFYGIACCYYPFTLLIIFYCINMQFINPFSHKWAFELFSVFTIENSIMIFLVLLFVNVQNFLFSGDFSRSGVCWIIVRWMIASGNNSKLHSYQLCIRNLMALCPHWKVLVWQHWLTLSS